MKPRWRITDAEACPKCAGPLDVLMGFSECIDESCGWDEIGLGARRAAAPTPLRAFIRWWRRRLFSLWLFAFAGLLALWRIITA